jgi:glucose-1-phosphate cytidylyltransferase
MKVVLFCGGEGMRLRDYSSRVPKPMVPVGQRPVLWHVMKYYAHFGHREFIICLGYKGQVIRDYFANLTAMCSSDRPGSRLANGGPDDWQVTFLDTGIDASIGQRLRAARECLAGEDIFLANYADVLTDAPLPEMVAQLRRQQKVASFLCVPPPYTFHVVSFLDGHTVGKIIPAQRSLTWINGGYFVLSSRIFDYLGAGEDLVAEPFERLVRERQLLGYPHKGFWAPMDTLKDRNRLEELWEMGRPPWSVWAPQTQDEATATELV